MRAGRIVFAWAALWAFVAVCAEAQDTAYQDYLARIAVLQRDGAAIAQRDGRDALIQQYRDLVAAYPDYPNNIRIETQVAMLYESDFSDAGQPPDLLAAHQTYQHILETYDPENPYMPTARKLAADRAADFDPALAQQMYEGIIADYPEEDALVVQSQYALGKLAESQGDSAGAEQHFSQIAAYAPSGAPLSDAETESIAAYQENAVASMLTAAIKGADTPEERLKALKKYLEKHGELEAAHADLVQRFAQAVQGKAGVGADARDVDHDDAPALDALFASLKKDKPGTEPGDSRDRVRAREQRARDAGTDRTRTARRDSTGALDSATLDAVATAGAGTADEAKPTRATPSTISNGPRRAYYTAAALGVSLVVIASGAYAARRRAQ